MRIFHFFTLNEPVGLLDVVNVRSVHNVVNLLLAQMSQLRLKRKTHSKKTFDFKTRESRVQK